MNEWPLQKSGSKGPRVKAAQRLLVHRSAKLDRIDGIFGPETETAVRGFQELRKLDADGKIGDKTWPDLVVQVRKDDEGEAVTAAQELLATQGAEMKDLEADGTFGPATEKAVRTIQARYSDLEVDGILGPQTWKALVTADPSN